MELNKKQTYILAISVFGFILFLVSLSNGFVWDDEEQIVNNVLIHSLSNLPKFFSGGAFHSGGTGSLLGIYYKPLMTLSFAIVYAIFGPNAFFFHLTSVLLHIANSILVFLIFSKFFKQKKSFLLSLIFLVHPLYSEVIFYAANFQDLLFFFFGSLALLFSLNKKHWLVVGLFLLGSILSKETGIVFVLAILFFKYWRSSIFAVLLYGFMRFGIAKIGFLKDHATSPISQLPLLQRILAIPKMAWYYFQNLLVPINLVANQHWTVQSLTLNNFFIPLIFSVIFITLILLLTFNKNKKYYFFLIFFVLSFGMHMQIFPLDVTVSGRWFYLPMFGLLGISGFAKIKKYKKEVEYFVYFLIVILSIITFRRAFDWKTGLALYSHDSEIVKDDFNLENNLGVELFRAGQINDAKIHFQNSVNLAPNWWTNWNNLGAIAEREENLDLAAKYYKKAIDNGNYYLAYENYALILIKQEKFAEAKEFILDSLQYFPQNPRLLYLLQALQSQDAKSGGKN